MAKVDFELASLYYNGYDYKNVILDAALKDQELTKGNYGVVIRS